MLYRTIYHAIGLQGKFYKTYMNEYKEKHVNNIVHALAKFCFLTEIHNDFYELKLAMISQF